MSEVDSYIKGKDFYIRVKDSYIRVKDVRARGQGETSSCESD